MTQVTTHSRSQIRIVRFPVSFQSPGFYGIPNERFDRFDSYRGFQVHHMILKTLGISDSVFCSVLSRAIFPVANNKFPISDGLQFYRILIQFSPGTEPDWGGIGLSNKFCRQFSEYLENSIPREPPDLEAKVIYRNHKHY